MENYKIALVDDHTLLRNGLAALIESLGDYTVLFEAGDGKAFINKLKPALLPELVLMDINMPEMDGYATCLWLKENYPHIRVLSLSMYDNESAVIRMFKAGAKGYILKDCDPAELKLAIEAIRTKGFYFSEMVTGKLIHSINTLNDKNSHGNVLNLNDREIAFLKLTCSELTYREIADRMDVSPRTIDSWRDDLFIKLDVKTRIGLVMYAVKNVLITL